MATKVFYTDYEKCKDPRKEMHWGMCRYEKKNDEIFCSLTNKRCPVFSGYKHGMYEKRENC